MHNQSPYAPHPTPTPAPAPQEGTPFIFPGTGTGGWEAALTNTLSPGDKVLTFRYGLFSHLWIDMMQRLGLDVTVVEMPWGQGACEQKLEEALRKDGGKQVRGSWPKSWGCEGRGRRGA